MKLTQEQCEAFADVLVLAMCMDGHFSLLEEDEIQNKISSVGWDENLSPQIHLSKSIAKARDVAGSPDAIKAHLETLVPILGHEDIAAFVVESAAKVLDSDGTKPEEATFLAQLKAVLRA